MNRVLSALGLLLVTTGVAIAQAGPSTIDGPSTASRDLVMRDGAVVLTTGPNTYNRYVKDAATDRQRPVSRTPESPAIGLLPMSSASPTTCLRSTGMFCRTKRPKSRKAICRSSEPHISA